MKEEDKTFWSEIKPHIDLLSYVKNNNSLPSNTDHSKIIELAHIHSKYISKVSCISCRPFKIVFGLINHYERAKKKGRKRKL
jgi:hypothetical protein